MSLLAPDSPGLPSRALHGIICVEIGTLFFVAQDAMMKSMLGLYPIWTLIFARSVMSVLVLLPLVVLLGGPHRLLTPLWPLHLARAALFATGFSLFYAAFPFMGLAEVTTIFFAAPLITALMAALWLRETIGPHRMGALVVGFAGVLIAMNPTGEAFSWIAILPLLCAVTYAASQIIARKIGDRETTLTVGLYTLGFSGLLILPMGWSVNQIIAIPPDYAHLAWAWPSAPLEDLPALALLGLCGMGGYLFLSRAYQVANASLVAPFDYSYLPFATVLAYILWDEVPGFNTVIGMTLIVISGLYIGYRELRAYRHSDTPAPVAETVFLPGSPLPQQIPDEEDAR
jgi:drug/metabolite transporter (DMT)-like permease